MTRAGRYSPAKEKHKMFKGYTIVESYATLSNYQELTKEFNLIDYGGKEPLYDIRKWDRSPIAERQMLKGITLNKDEMRKLKEAIDKIDLD